MKSLYITSMFSLFLCIPLQGINDDMMLTTIFTPAPLLELPQKNMPHYITMLKKASIPLSCCLCCCMQENNMYTDSIQNPLTTSVCIYALGYYCWCMYREKQQSIIDQEILSMMQHVFHLLIIGHGVYNKITNHSFCKHRIVIANNVYTLTTMQLFLHNAYSTWFILFSYYQEHYKNKPLYTYHMDQIDVFEILQASTHEPDILPLITNFYNKNNPDYDYEAIFNCLEIKLKQINHKMKSIFPT